MKAVISERSFQTELHVMALSFSDSLIIYQVKTKKTTTVKDIDFDDMVSQFPP